MPETDQPDDVNEVLHRVEDAGDDREVSVGDIVQEIGNTAFGPLLLVPALILVTPASGIPGLPTVGSLLISLIAVQILLGRESLWLPGFLRRREMKKSRLDRAISFLRRPAGFIDRFTSERLVILTRWPWIALPAALCTLMVLVAPAFETVPFSVSIAGFAVALFALGMVARDGIMILLGLVVMAGTGYVIWTAIG